jgi:hypothetical protein
VTRPGEVKIAASRETVDANSKHDVMARMQRLDSMMKEGTIGKRRWVVVQCSAEQSRASGQSRAGTLLAQFVQWLSRFVHGPGSLTVPKRKPSLLRLSRWWVTPNCFERVALDKDQIIHYSQPDYRCNARRPSRQCPFIFVFAIHAQTTIWISRQNELLATPRISFKFA